MKLMPHSYNIVTVGITTKDTCSYMSVASISFSICSSADYFRAAATNQKWCLVYAHSKFCIVHNVQRLAHSRETPLLNKAAISTYFSSLLIKGLCSWKTGCSLPKGVNLLCME